MLRSLRALRCRVASWLIPAFLFASPILTAADPAEAARIERIATIFRPFQTDRAALAPDGRHLAYELRRDERLFLVIVNLDAKTAVELPLLEDEAVPLSGVSEKVPARITHLSWATATRLIVTVQDEALFAVDADGRNFRSLIEPASLAFVTSQARERSAPLSPGSHLIPGYNRDEASLFGSADSPQGLELRQLQREAEWLQQVDPNAVLRGPTADGTGVPDASAISTHTDLGNPMNVDLFNSSSGSGAIPVFRAFVADLLLDQPDEILVEARGRSGPWDDGPIIDQQPAANAWNVVTGLFRLNIHTGKITWWDSDFATSRMMADRLGRPRLALRHFSTRRTYTVAAKPGARFRNLDLLTAEAGLAPAEITPERFFERRTIPLGFGFDPNVLYFASNQDRDTFGIYAFDLATKRRTDVAIEHPYLDLVDFNEAIPEQALVFDRHSRRLVGVRLEGLRKDTHWVDPEMQAFQTKLRELAPALDFEILDWNADRTRFLLLGSNQFDPGAYYVFERGTGLLNQYVQRAPWIERGLASTTTPLTVTTNDGVTLRGYFTFPRQIRTDPVPVLVYCHDGPWSRDRAGFDRGAQALASMGFAVLQINYRGSSGYGRAHLNALREGGETVALKDILTALDVVQKTHAVSPKRVAILGNGYGGYLALRALQLHPDRFRCAVSINAPTDLPVWFNHPKRAFSFARDLKAAFFQDDNDALRTASPVNDPAAFTQPLLIVQADADTVVPESQARALLRALDGASPIEPEFLALPYEGHARWLTGSYVKVFARLEEFFTANIFTFTTDIGESIVIPEPRE